ncbi:MAG: hypothetical protein VW715_08260 [Rhodospirillales bacterium]
MTDEGFGYLLIDLRTGMMDGMYRNVDDAKRLKEYLEQKYDGSFWEIFKPMTGRGNFKGYFPPDHLFHADVAENFGYKIEEML